MADRTVSVALKLKINDYVGNARTVMATTKGIAGELDQLGQKHKDRFNQLSTAAGGLGLALSGAFALTVKSAMDFDKEMSAVASVSGASGKALEQLRSAAIRAGQATVYSAGQAAQAEEELAKAGVSTADILGGGLSGALSLAAAGGIDLASAATDASTAMNVFSLKGKDVGHIADVLASAANTSATDVGHLSMALSQGGQVAAQTGLTLEDTVGTLAALAQAGLQGSDAGTSLKTMLQALANPTGVTADLMRQLGINAYDAAGNFIGITGLAQQLQDKMKGLTQAQRDQAMAQIFGSDAVRSANVLYKLGAQGLQQYITGVNQVGAAEDTASQRMNNLAGDVENLKGSVETLAITAGEGANTGLRDLAQAATRIVNSVGEMPASMQTAITLTTGLSGAGLVGAVGMLKLRQKIGEVREALNEMGPIGSKASGVLGKVAGAAGKVTIALAALQAVSAALGSDVNPSIAATSKELDKFAKTGDKTGQALSHLDYDLGTLGSGGMTKAGNAVAGFVESVSGLGSVMDESMYHAKERISAIDQTLAALASGGHTDEAAAAFAKLADEAKKSGISVDDLKAGLPQYEAVLAGATASQQQNIKVTEDQKQKTNALATSVQDAVDRYGSFKDMIDGLNGTHEDSVKATLDAKQAVDDLRKSLQQNGDTLDLNKQKGRDNMSTVLRLADAARDAAQATYQETGSVQQATGVYNAYKGQLIDTLVQSGKTRKEAQKLADQLMQIPKNITTNVNIVTTKIDNGTQRTHHDSYGNRWGGLYQHAADGLLRDAQVFSAVSSGARYAIAEPQTGGEAFVPRLGDYARSTSILDRASRWYGGRFMPGGAGGGGQGGGTVKVEVRFTGGGFATMFNEQLRTGQITIKQQYVSG